jgi:hypothetical protein
MRDRTLLVLELIRNPRAEPGIIEELAEYGRDCDCHLAMVSRSDVLVILRQFLEETLSASEISAWASRLDERQDVGFEFGEEGAVKEAVSWLAYPNPSQPVDAELCRHIEIMFERRHGRRDTP